MASSCDAVAKWTKNGSTADVKQASYQPQRAYTTRMSDICAPLDVVGEGPVPSRGPNAHPIGRAGMSPRRGRAERPPLRHRIDIDKIGANLWMGIGECSNCRCREGRFPGHYFGGGGD